MRRQATCNLVKTLPHPPWSSSLDREVYMTPDGEERVPFHLYVQPTRNSVVAPTYSADLSMFDQLPDEIQLRILAVCPASTLFQLMHTSYKLRTEALKLFWGKRDAYFLVEARWLMSKAYPGDSYWDMAFLANVQKVEIECRAGIRQEICVQRDDVCDVQHHLVDAF